MRPGIDRGCAVQVFLQSPAGSAAAALLMTSQLNVAPGPPALAQTLVRQLPGWFPVRVWGSGSGA